MPGDGFGNLDYSVVWIAQMAECRTSDPKVEGSIPFPDAIFHINSLIYVNRLNPTLSYVLDIWNCTDEVTSFSFKYLSGTKGTLVVCVYINCCLNM